MNLFRKSASIVPETVESRLTDKASTAHVVVQTARTMTALDIDALTAQAALLSLSSREARADAREARLAQSKAARDSRMASKAADRETESVTRTQDREYRFAQGKAEREAAAAARIQEREARLAEKKAAREASKAR